MDHLPKYLPLFKFDCQSQVPTTNIDRKKKREIRNIFPRVLDDTSMDENNDTTIGL